VFLAYLDNSSTLGYPRTIENVGILLELIVLRAPQGWLILY
jgi:hypothetical protein